MDFTHNPPHPLSPPSLLYTRLREAPESPDAFPALLPRRNPRPPAGLGGGRASACKLKKQGSEFSGLSPFNQEKTPSFFVNDQKGSWFDFSAGKNGDIFTFVMETEGLSFPEAVERLAGEAGVPMPARDAEAEAREKERATLYDVLELAAKFFEERAASRAAGAPARGYLAQSRPRPRSPAPLPHRLCAARPERAEGAPRRQGRHPGRR